MGIKETLLANGAKLVVRAKKYSPEILVAAGIAGVITSTVLACKATLKAKAILEAHEKNMAAINKAKDEFDDEAYSEKDYKKDLAIQYTQTALSFAKLYGPSVILGAAAIGCIVGSHAIMVNRNAALVTAFNVLSDEFGNYRKAVVKEVGEEKEKEIRAKSNVEKAAEAEFPFEPDGEEKGISRVDSRKFGRYTRIFDECAREYTKNADYNKAFLMSCQNQANHMLAVHGTLFLNEIYDMLGFERTKEGSVVGWAYRKDKDNFVDFGIYSRLDLNANQINGNDPAFILDFNVQGVVYDLI